MAGRHRKPSPRHHRGRHRRPTPPTRWIAPTLATVAVLAAGGVSAYSALSGGGGSAGPPAASISSTPGLTSNPPTPPPSPAAAHPTPAARTPPPAPAGRPQHTRPAPALRLVSVGGVSWVEVTRAGGHVAFSGLLRRGHHLVYPHGPLAVTVGNAGAVHAVRYGHADGRLGRPGQVVRFTVR